MAKEGFKFGLIGFGEVGRIFAKHLTTQTDVYVYDVLMKANNLEEGIKALGATPANSMEEICENCNVIFSIVNSSASTAVAEEASKFIKKGTFLFDMTTSTPNMKKQSEKYIAESGGVYVDAGIMGTVATQQHKVPLLIAGKNEESTKLLADFGFNPEALDLENGAAAGIKLIRSVFMKGYEALFLETLIAAEKYGIMDEVLKSVADTLNDNECVKLTTALLCTHVVHRKRRCKEVGDSKKLLVEANIDPVMTEATENLFKYSVDLDIPQEILESNDLKRIINFYIAQTNEA